MTEETNPIFLEEQAIGSVELGRRQIAKRKMHDFVQYVDKRYFPLIPHVEFICHELDDVVRFVETGEGTQILVLTVPPRHLKTTLVAEMLPAFFLGRNPNKLVINTTYAAGLAHDSSRRVRAMLRENEQYVNLFGERASTRVDGALNPVPDIELSSESSAVDRWQLDGYMGLYQAVGFGGTLTGKGGHLIVVDDPHASRKEAESQTERNNAWTFVISTLWPRLEENGAMVIIMQRWTEDDVVGRLLRIKDPNNEDYIPEFPPIKFVNMPAIAEESDPLRREPGAALWPQKKTVDDLQATRGVMGDYYFNSQYQQRATAPEGNLFKRNWFRVVPYFPFDYKIQYWDTAESIDPKADYWACITLGINKFGITVFDMFRKQMSPDEGQEEIFRRYDMFNTEQEPVAVVWIQTGSSGKSMVSLANAGDRTIPIEEDKIGTTTKEFRAGSITTVCKNRRVGLVQHAPWIREFLDEVCAFPNGAHDDQVDVLAGGVGKLVHGGFVRIADQIRRREKKHPELGADYREQKFGRDGRGIPVGRRGLRKSPSVPLSSSSYPPAL